MTHFTSQFPVVSRSHNRDRRFALQIELNDLLPRISPVGVGEITGMTYQDRPRKEDIKKKSFSWKTVYPLFTPSPKKSSAVSPAPHV